ncbi:hypothetical protein HPB48_014653 [Haemaphysalis longicornis]|uniref:Uncharacterized protein n=1 Tax=Haemaphysalis longicornis TaxID=44386 RepID=A0A9J6G981_HAELO|nr:hypothetical protein HPB48_014653 [Haemaphysalis longicornis]
MKLWIQDMAGVVPVHAVADLAGEYALRSGERDEVPPVKAGDKRKTDRAAGGWRRYDGTEKGGLRCQ